MKPGEWVDKVQRKPWVIGARGPDAFDCYGLCYFVRKTFFGQEIPRWDVTSYDGVKDLARAFSDRFNGWEPVKTPSEGCIVALSKFPRIVHHCGVYTEADRGLVVHTTKTAGRVIAQSLADLRRDGWKRIEFFRFISEDSIP